MVHSRLLATACLSLALRAAAQVTVTVNATASHPIPTTLCEFRCFEASNIEKLTTMKGARCMRYGDRFMAGALGADEYPRMLIGYQRKPRILYLVHLAY